MSSRDKITFSKSNIDLYLKELAKEYRRLGGRKLPAEMILIGGASVLINYGFRDMTTDIDAIIQSASTMKEAINAVGDKYNSVYRKGREKGKGFAVGPQIKRFRPVA